MGSALAGPLPDFSLNWVTEYSNISANSRWVLFNNLKAAAAYQFRVSAENSVGEGPSSEPSNVVVLPQERKYTAFAVLSTSIVNANTFARHKPLAIATLLCHSALLLFLA
jgi:hypothetical protein